MIGLVVASVCGSMAGLIGASNSPLSGIGILAILAASRLLAGLYAAPRSPETTQAPMAYALVVTGVVFGVATISNDNLRDLKTGQLVGATPWRQQVALVIGVVSGALVVPPVLNLLGATLGFQCAPHAGPDALATPRAALTLVAGEGCARRRPGRVDDQRRRPRRRGADRPRRRAGSRRAPAPAASRRRARRVPADDGDAAGRARRGARPRGRPLGRTHRRCGRGAPHRRAHRHRLDRRREPVGRGRCGHRLRHQPRGAGGLAGAAGHGVALAAGLLGFALMLGVLYRHTASTARKAA